MCGICGYIHLDRTKRPDPAVVRAMMDTLRRRGPDDEGVFLKDNAALAHKRLSIIDLETGHQPMHNEDGSVTIVYNGEVYNFLELKETLSKKGHIFRTHSDTEVVIHAYEEYGEDCLKYFNGMFALAIWDFRKEALLLARDRFGKKPLYYAVFDNQFIFASELKAVLKHPAVKREIDPLAVRKYLAYEYVPSPHSIFKGIYKLQPASRLILRRDGSHKIDAYWDLPLRPQPNLEPEEAGKRLLELFKASVKRRLISDVPLGVFLSGGIDSSSVVAMMAELMAPSEIKTFSVGFKEKSFDESGDARMIAERFGTDHREEILKPEAMLGVLPEVLDILDEPFADSSIIPTYLVSRFTRRHVKVALGGDGGDELFLGYPSFLAHRLNDYFDFVPDFVKRLALNSLSGLKPAFDRYMSLGFYARRFLRGLDFPEEVRHQVWIGSFTPDEQKPLFLESAGPDCGPQELYDSTSAFYRKAAEADPLTRAMYIYVKTYMTDDILAKVDRASMANSLEARAPFLDTDFALFAASIPSAYKLKDFSPKWILKSAMRKVLPEETLNKPKHGFAVPVAKWLKEDLHGLLAEAFDEAKIRREGIFDYGHIKKLVGDYRAGRRDLRKEIWSLFMFESWYDRWM